LSASVALALGALVCFGLGDLVYKRAAAAGAQPHQFLMVQTWLFVPAVAVYAALTGTLRFVAASAWGAVAGLFMVVGFYNFARSLRSGAVSINAPIFRLSFVLTAALAIALLGERLTLFKSCGIALALLAAWLLLGARARRIEDAALLRSSLMQVLVATVSVGVGNFIYTLGLREGATAGSLVVAQSAVVSTLATAFTASVDRRIRPSMAALRYAPLAGIVLAAAFVCLVEGMARGQASIVVPIAQMGFVVTALLGIAFLHEPFSARKAAGIAAAVGALGSLAHG
jgi:drug/metabolite transporter (DMT)-like permease